MPRREPISPDGIYHVGSRGCYGRTLFHDVSEHELFLWMYTRVARKYGGETLAWALMKNHHHLVIKWTQGGLSEGLRVLHGGYSRRIHEFYGETRKGHLFRHAFFARQLDTTEDVLGTCAYVDLNPARHRRTAAPRVSDWCGYRATLGRQHPRNFHAPPALLELLDPSPAKARRLYQQRVQERHDRERQVSSPNDGGYAPRG